MGAESLSLAVVIPAYKARNEIEDVIRRIPKNVPHIIVVDDCCPEQTGQFVADRFAGDKRVEVITNSVNRGVGGATKVGFSRALELKVDTVVKIDADGQMDPALIPDLIRPLVEGDADYCKGNRFTRVSDLKSMPRVRVLGNAGLSFLTKASSGYWSVSDPTNGFVAISKSALESLELEKISERYFFESDMLFRLGLQGSVVSEVRMAAHYGAEKSSLSPLKSFFEFSWKHNVNFLKRIMYRHFLREWTLVTFQLPASLVLLVFGGTLGVSTYLEASARGVPMTAGQITTASLLTIVGFQLFLSAVSHDVLSEPKRK